MTRFSDDTALEPVGGHRYRGSIDRGWFIEAGPNGGYLAAIVLRAFTLEIASDAEVDAATDGVGDGPPMTPRSLAVHYLRPPAEGEVTLEVTVERRGRTMANATARMWQGEKLQALAIAAFGSNRSAPTFVDLAMPEVAAPEEIEPWPTDPEAIPMRGRYDQRWAIGAEPLEGSDRALTGGWMRLGDHDPVDHLVLAAMTDAWIPPVFSRLGVYLGVPTIDLTIHFRADMAEPIDDFVFATFETKVAAHGYLEEDGVLWSRDGTLLAQSRQLAAIIA